MSQDCNQMLKHSPVLERFQHWGKWKMEEAHADEDTELHEVVCIRNEGQGDGYDGLE